MFSSILESLQDQVGPELMEKAGISKESLPQVIDVIGDSSKNVLGKQIASGNMGSIMSLFSSGANNSGAIQLQSNLTTNIVSGLAQKLGMSESQAQTVGSIVVPYLIKMISSKNEQTSEDNDSPIQELFSGGTGDLLSKAKKGLGGLF